MSRLIKPYPDTIPDSKLPLLQGTVGEGAGIEFHTFTQIYADLVTIKEILANPETCKVPKEPSVAWALTGVVANAIDKTNAPLLIKYIDRMQPEFAILTLRQAAQREASILELPEVEVWLTKAGSILM